MEGSTAELSASSSPCSEGAPRPAPSRVRGDVRDVARLTAAERAAMRRVMETYFAGVSREQFEADLAEKRWAITLEDEASGALCGFSTMSLFEVEVDGARVAAVVSGDTIVERDYWGETTLARVWSRHAFRVAEESGADRAFWLLICSGYKTYRFLPVFFREFAPAPGLETPPGTRRLLEALATARYGDAFDAAAGVVRFARPTPLREGVAEVTPSRLRDEHVAFFHRANPGHADGDELVCLTELRRDNLTAAGRRMLFGR